MKCAKCNENVKGGVLSHMNHIFRHYKWWGNAIFREKIKTSYNSR